MKSRVIAVVGMHRSGTSAVTRGIKALGAELGNRLMPAKAGDNPKGFWEDLDIVDLDEAIQEAVGLSSWHSVRSVDPGAWEAASLDELKDYAATLIASKFGTCPLWSFKDPRAARLLPFWKDVFRRLGISASYVLVVRNPISVARSLTARNALPAEKSHLLWLGHMLPAFLDTAGERRVVVDFDRLMSAPGAQLARIAAVLDIPLTGQVRQEVRAFGEQFLDGGHRHSVFGADQVESDPAVLLLARRAFRVLDRVAADAASADDPDVLAAMRVLGEELVGFAPLCRLADDLESAHAVSSQDLGGAKRTIGVLRQQLSQARREAEAARQLRTEALGALEQTRRSLSWRLTAPLRQGHWLAGRLARASRATAEAGGVTGGAADVVRGTDAGAVPGTGPGGGDAPVEFSFPLPEAEPEVSVIVAAVGPADCVMACLRSIHDAGSYRSFEVIVVDDGGPAAEQGLAATRGTLLLKNERPMGHVRSLNRGSRAARGRYLLFLGADVLVAPGWLDELVASLEEHSHAGFAGSMVVGVGGRILEAGRRILADGSLSRIGGGGDPEKLEYSFVRDVECCSLTSMMVPRELFLDLGGFDEGYALGPYAAADLALTLEERSKAVLLQPLSRVVQAVGGEPVTDGGADAARIEHQSRGRLREKWPEAFARREELAAAERVTDAGPRRGRVLVIDALTPTPDKDAGSVDMMSYLRIFRLLSYAVTFVAENQLRHCGEYTAALQRLGVECLYEPCVNSVRAHLQEHGSRYDLVMIARAPTAARHMDDVRQHCPNAVVIFHTVDLHHLREQREAALARSAALAASAAETKAAELSMIARSDCTIVVSTAEQQILSAEEAVRGKRIVVMPLCVPIPGRSAPFASRRDIVFLGGFLHPPNVDAVVHFTREIWPLVRPRLPGCRFLVVGSNPTPDVLALRDEGVLIAGHVENLGSVFGTCRLSVAPLRYGAGIKGKVLTSMSHGVPCVATPMAVEGGGFRHGEDVLVADTPQDFADALARAYGDEALWSRLSGNGLAFVRRGYALETGRVRVESLLASLR